MIWGRMISSQHLQAWNHGFSSLERWFVPSRLVKSSYLKWKTLTIHAAPPHRVEPAGVAWVFVSNGPWTALLGGVPGMSRWNKIPGKIQDTLEWQYNWSISPLCPTITHPSILSPPLYNHNNYPLCLAITSPFILFAPMLPVHLSHLAH